MHVPGDDRVVGVTRVVILGVDLDAVAVRVTQVEVEGVRDAVTTRAALDRVAHAQRAELVADREDVVLLVRREGNVVQAGAVATRGSGVVHGSLAAQPRSVHGALFVLDVLGHAEAEILVETHGAGHVGGDLVEVVEANELARLLQIVAPCEALDVVGLEEELVGEAERVDDAHRVTDALHEAVRVAAHVAAELGVEGHGLVEVFVRANAVRECGDRGDRALAQHQVVVNELLRRAQVDRLVVFFGHVETEYVNVEVARGGEVGDHELHVRATKNVGSLGLRRRDRVVGLDGCFLGHPETRRGLVALVQF